MFFTHGGKAGGRPNHFRLPLALSETFRADFNRKRKRKDVTLEHIIVAFESGDLPERSPSWLSKALKPGTSMAATHAIEIAERAHHLGIRISDFILKEIEEAIEPEPAVIVMPRQSARFAKYICQRTLGEDTKATRQIESKMQKLFERFEKANSCWPVDECLTQLVHKLGDPTMGKTLMTKGVPEKVARQLAHLRDTDAIDRDSYAMLGRLSRLAIMRRSLR